VPKKALLSTVKVAHMTCALYSKSCEQFLWWTDWKILTLALLSELRIHELAHFWMNYSFESDLFNKSVDSVHKHKSNSFGSSTQWFGHKLYHKKLSVDFYGDFTSFLKLEVSIHCMFMERKDRLSCCPVSVVRISNFV